MFIQLLADITYFLISAEIIVDLILVYHLIELFIMVQTYQSPVRVYKHPFELVMAAYHKVYFALMFLFFHIAFSNMSSNSNICWL